MSWISRFSKRSLWYCARRSSEQHVVRTQIRTVIWVIRDPSYGTLIYQVRELLKTRMQLKWSQNLAAHSFLKRDFTGFDEGFRATILMRCRRGCKFPLCPPLGIEILQFTVIPASNHLALGGGHSYFSSTGVCPSHLGSNELTTRVKYRVWGTTELSGRVKNGV